MRCATAILVASEISGGAVLAQAVAPEDTSTDIIVTARKRAETDMSVPVAIAAVGSAELERRGIDSLDALSNSVPALRIGPAPGSVQGGTITLRGIGASADNPLADQSVSLNIDGAQVARSSVQRMAQMDVAQIEVLKGPQALFFGKNSPGGIISIRTNDPTDHFEARAQAGYEMEAQEWRGEGYVSAPVTDTLGIRFAGYGSLMRGWVTNEAPASTPPVRRHLPHDREYAGRLTLKFDPSSAFNARLKLTYNHLRGAGPSANDQFVNCITPGVTQYGDVDDCRADDTVRRGNIGTGYAALDPGFKDGRPYHVQKQLLSSLEMNYHVADALTLSSVTGYYDLGYDSVDNYTRTSNPGLILTARNLFQLKEFSQELRLASDFDGPIDFLVGGYFQHSKARYFNPTAIGLFGAPLLIIDTDLHQTGDAWSMFGQISWNITDRLELAGGGRYSDEKKSVDVVSFGQPAQPPEPKGSWHNFSPEVTLTWRPTSDLTLFGAYKRGFLSGGFNGGPVGPTDPRDYDQQTIRGFEGGVKARLADESIRANLTAYRYDARGLQVTTTNTTPGGGVSQTTTNAGQARIQGIEGDVNWTTPARGLTLRGSIAYTRARYRSFLNNCYVGQSIGEGCNVNLVNGAFTQQDFAGKQIIRAPDWTAGVGFNYDIAVAGDLSLGLSSDAAYTSSYYTAATASPGSRKSGYWLLDASIRLSPADRDWELAIVGNNLTNRYYYSGSYEALFAPGPTGTATPGRRADTIASISRGRQIMLRVTKTFR
jgi:iron complex outermembrane receptor protein